MKKITLFMALLCAISLFAQKRIPAKVQQLVNGNTTFKPVSPLQVAQNVTTDAAKIVEKATFATLNEAVVKQVANNKYPYIELNVPYNGQNIALLLYRTEVAAQGFHIDTDKRTNVPYNQGAYYRGIVKGNYNSVAAFSFFQNGMTGIVSSNDFQNLVVGRLKTEGSSNNYIIYSDAEMNVRNNFKCAANESSVLPGFRPKNKMLRETQNEHCVTLYFEIDYTLYEENNYSVTEATDWITAIFNNVQTLYDNDGITTAIRTVFIWTEQDPYSGTGSSDYLYEFFRNRPAFDADAAMLLGDDEGGLGGVAITIAGLCSKYNVSYSDVNYWYEDIPVFSWNVEVITHELGHLFGSPHTHGCYWNGNDTAIDGCGSSAGYVEGNCEIADIPEESVGGTIMSYCHLIDGVGINFANGFGPQPAQRIQDHIASSMCLSTDCINVCTNDITSIDVISTSLNSINLRLSHREGETSPGPWQIAYAPYGQTPENWQDATSADITLNGLSADTYYNIAVRRACNTTQLTTAEQSTTMTDADWCNGVNWTDTGADDNYGDDENIMRVIRATPGHSLNITFDQFDLEQDYDFMYIYNGVGTTGELLGAYTGNDTPGPFTLEGDAVLTFVFVSDSYLNFSGWEANIECTLDTKSNTFNNLVYFPNPVRNSLNISAQESINKIEIYNVAGQLLAHYPVNALSHTVNLAAYAEGVYLVKVFNATASKTLKIVKE